MRCGKCKADGPSVTFESVRECYAGHSHAEQEKERLAEGRHQVPVPGEYDAYKQASMRPDGTRTWPTCEGMAGEPMWPASDAQIKYVLDLQDGRVLPNDYKVKSEDDLRRMERDEVSSTITLLKTFSRKDTGSQPQWSMPAGRYALAVDDGTSAEDVWCFFQVDKPDQGRWKGYTFIKRLIGAPGDYRKVDMSPAERRAILQLIENDPKQAMIDYGLQSGVCGACGSPLTNAQSLALGMGPICAGKVGWF